MNFSTVNEYLPFAVNLAFLGVGYWAGTRGPAKLWQDLTGDIADIKTKITSLETKVTPVVPTKVVTPATVTVAPAVVAPVANTAAVVHTS